MRGGNASTSPSNRNAAPILVWHRREALDSIVRNTGSASAGELPTTGITPLKPANPAELQKYLLAHKPELEVFRLRGPFRVTPLKDVAIRLSDGSVNADLYLCAAAEKVPLVILLHGHGNSKDDHVFQILHVATWGMHAMTTDLPNQGPWIANGRTLKRLVDAIRQEPETVGSNVDVQRIILVGHSFHQGQRAGRRSVPDRAPAATVRGRPHGHGRIADHLRQRVDSRRAQ